MVYVQGIVVDADRFIFNLSRKFLNELTTKGNEILRETIPANRNGLDIRDLVFRENHEAQKLADDYGFSLEALFDEIKGMDYPLRKENLGTEITMYEDAGEFLKKYPQFVFGMVSDTPKEIVMDMIDYFDLSEIFPEERVVCTNYNEKDSKPNPIRYKELMATTGLSRDRAVYGGDSIIKDVGLANNADTYSLHVTRDGENFTRLATVSDMNMVKAWERLNEM